MSEGLAGDGSSACAKILPARQISSSLAIWLFLHLCQVVSLSLSVFLSFFAQHLQHWRDDSRYGATIHVRDSVRWSLRCLLDGTQKWAGGLLEFQVFLDVLRVENVATLLRYALSQSWQCPLPFWLKPFWRKSWISGKFAQFLEIILKTYWFNKWNVAVSKDHDSRSCSN